MEHTLYELISGIIGQPLAAMGYGLVQIRIIEGGRRTLQIMAERNDRRNMTVEDCAQISHTVSALLDVADPIKGAYTLEVSSPGIDRPLLKKEDFQRFQGFDAKIETRVAIEGRKRFKGKLIALEGETLLMALQDGEVHIPLAQVSAAKLILTDALIAWHGKEEEATH